MFEPAWPVDVSYFRARFIIFEFIWAEKEKLVSPEINDCILLFIFLLLDFCGTNSHNFILIYELHLSKSMSLTSDNSNTTNNRTSSLLQDLSHSYPLVSPSTKRQSTHLMEHLNSNLFLSGLLLLALATLVLNSLMCIPHLEVR